MILLVISLVVVSGCTTDPCRQSRTLAEVRSCMCGVEVPPSALGASNSSDAGAARAGSGAASADPRIEEALSALGSESFDEYARAGRELIEIGKPAFDPLICAPMIVRETHEMEQDPVDRVLLVILEQSFSSEDRERLHGDPLPQKRLYAVRSIRFRRATAEADRLLAALADSNYHVREEALEALHALAAESRIRKPRNQLYQTPNMRQAREIERWQARFRAEGQAIFERDAAPE